MESRESRYELGQRVGILWPISGVELGAIREVVLEAQNSRFRISAKNRSARSRSLIVASSTGSSARFASYFLPNPLGTREVVPDFAAFLRANAASLRLSITVSGVVMRRGSRHESYIIDRVRPQSSTHPVTFGAPRTDLPRQRGISWLSGEKHRHYLIFGGHQLTMHGENRLFERRPAVLCSRGEVVDCISEIVERGQRGSGKTAQCPNELGGQVA
jgi:hypothetical protein